MSGEEDNDENDPGHKKAWRAVDKFDADRAWANVHGFGGGDKGNEWDEEYEDGGEEAEESDEHDQTRRQKKNKQGRLRDGETSTQDPATDHQTEIPEGTIHTQPKTIPPSMFLNKNTRFPADSAHLLVTHKYYGQFQPLEYEAINETTPATAKGMQLKKWSKEYNSVRTSMQESAKFAIETRGHRMALKWMMKIDGQNPTGMRDVLSLLQMETTWTEDNLVNTRNFLHAIKYGEEGDSTCGSAEREWQKSQNIVYEHTREVSRTKRKMSSYHKQVSIEKINLNKQIERIEIRMIPGELVRHNKINKTTPDSWEAAEEWTGSFSGEGYVHRLRASLSFVEIKHALKSWNIKDRLVDKIKAHIGKRAPPPDSPTATVATEAATTARAATAATTTATATAAIIATATTADGGPALDSTSPLPRGAWKTMLDQAAAMDWRVSLEVVLTAAKAVSNNTAIRKVVEASLSK